MTLVSVIIPCYNYAHFLPASLETVIRQTHENWECIIVDDGSVDNTSEVANAYAARDSRIKYVYQKNAGLSAARNTGVAASRGTYVQLLDADDFIEARKLELQAQYLDDHAHVDIAYGDARYFTSDNLDARLYSMGLVNQRWMPYCSGSGRAVLVDLVRSNIMVVNAALFRRSVVEQVGAFNEALRGHEDWEFWLRCALADKRFEFLDTPGTDALVRSHHVSMSKDRVRMLTTSLEVRRWLQNMPLSKQASEINEQNINETRAELGLLRVRSGHLLKGLIDYLIALKSAKNKRTIVKCFPLLIFSRRQIHSLLTWAGTRSGG